MGYLTDNIPPTVFGAVCEDLYIYRVIIDPRFASDRELQQLVKEVIPDVEEWQFSGRRTRCPRSDGKQVRIVHPYGYSNRDRKTRRYLERVVFAFHTSIQRDQVTAQLSAQGFKYTIENEPTQITPEEMEEVIVILP